MGQNDAVRCRAAGVGVACPEPARPTPRIGPSAKRHAGSPPASVRPLSLRHNFSWTLAGNVVYAGSQWGVLVVLAKLGTPETVGRFALGLALTTPVFALTSLRLRAVQVVDAKHEYRFADYFRLRMITSVIAILCVVGILVVARYPRETTLTILAVAFGKAFAAVSDVFYGLIQKHERMDRVARGMTLQGILSLVGLAAGVWLTGSVIWGAAGWAAGAGLAVVAYNVPAGIAVLRLAAPTRQPIPDEGPETTAHQGRGGALVLWKLTRFALPLGLVTALVSLNTNLPRYLVERHLGESQLGIFVAIAYLMVAANLVRTALARAASPRLARLHAEGQRQAFAALLRRLVTIGTLAGVVGILVAVVAGRQILTLLYAPEYAQHMSVLIWLAVAAALSFVKSFLGAALTAAKRFKSELLVNLFATAILAGGCAAMIPTYGLVGAASVVTFTALLTLVLYALLVCHVCATIPAREIRS